MSLQEKGDVVAAEMQGRWCVARGRAGVPSVQAKDTKDGWGHQKPGEAGTRFSLSLQKQTDPVKTLILDFWSLEPGANKTKQSGLAQWP